MKTTSNVVKGVRLPAIATMMAMASLLPVMQPNTVLALESKSSPFCTNLSTKVTTVTDQFTTATGKVGSAWSEQDQKIATDYTKVDQDVTTARQKADSDRDAAFTKLEAKATTDAQKQAVQAYEAAVKVAVSTRRAAYDAARQTFRIGVKNIILTHRSVITSQVDQFKATVNTAATAARASCTANPSGGATTREALVSALKTARQTFQSDRKSDETVGSQVKQLAATRNDAFKAANQVFQASMAAARDALKQAFNGSNTSV